MVSIIVLIGIITFYSGPFIGKPLRCEGIYDTTRDWIAIDIDHYGGWRCGDLVEIEDLRTGEYRQLRIMDSGPLSAYCVREGDECTEIVGDVPGHTRWFGGMSTRVRMVNRTELLRQWMEEMK